MKTYLKLQFSSEGDFPSQIIKKLEKQGWRPIVGERDFVMDWGIGESVGASYLKKLDDSGIKTNIQIIVLAIMIYIER